MDGFGPVGPAFGPMFRGGFNPHVFKKEYTCNSMLVGDKESANYGGKILLPPSALDHLMRMDNIEYPMMFKLVNKSKNMETHAGVLEFTAPSGKVFLPYWMMRRLLLEEGEVVSVEYKKLPKASFAKFQPQSMSFIEDISDHRAVLERHLRDFSCLSQGDVISIHYLNKDYEVSVQETKPANAVSIVDTDMNVDFATPVGYKEESMGRAGVPIKKGKKANNKLLDHTEAGSPMGTPEIRNKIEDHLIKEAKEEGFVAFTGGAARLDGKKKGTKAKNNKIQADLGKYKRGIPNHEFKVGTLNFIRSTKPSESSSSKRKFEEFGGNAEKLRGK